MTHRVERSSRGPRRSVERFGTYMASPPSGTGVKLFGRGSLPEGVTGRRNPQRVDGLFRQSGLFREKWDVRHHSNGQTYGQHTIAEAMKRTEFYDWEKRKRRNRKRTGPALSSDLPALSLQLPAGRTEMASAQWLFTCAWQRSTLVRTLEELVVWDGKRWSVDEAARRGRARQRRGSQVVGGARRSDSRWRYRRN